MKRSGRYDMDLMEYKAMELYERYGIPAAKGVVIDNAEDLLSKTADLKYPLVIKAQVQTGGRGKAGGIVFAEDPGEAMKISRKILGMDIRGHIVRKILIAEKIEVQKEWYLAIALDRLSKCPAVIFSTTGGIDIEETALASPVKILKMQIDPLIGINEYFAMYLLSRSGSDLSYLELLFDLLKKLYRMFIGSDCLLAEINPLAVTAEGRLAALDGKVSIDDSALRRQPDILEFRDSLPENELVLKARKFNFLYIPCDKEGNIGVMSNGSGMIMSCIDMIAGEGMKVGAALDLGGGATSERIREAVGIICSNEDIKALLINIFGGITRCDEVASGVKAAVEAMSERKLILVRLEGTNKEKGIEILRSIQGKAVLVNSLREGVRELAARRCEL
jgi:succinyl-CoA synthetase beta subunit